jgi:hypothetical protein
VFANLTGGIREISEKFPWVKDIRDFNAESINLLFRDTIHEISNPFDKSKITDEYLSLYNKVLKEQ